MLRVWLAGNLSLPCANALGWAVAFLAVRMTNLATWEKSLERFGSHYWPLRCTIRTIAARLKTSIAMHATRTTSPAGAIAIS